MSNRNIDEIITAHGQGTGDLAATRNARAELAALRNRISTLEKCQIDHENDCAVLPEDFSVTEYVTQLCAKLATLRAELQAAQATIALNKYVVPPFELTDDATVQLALELARKDERIAELETAVNEASEALLPFASIPCLENFDDDQAYDAIVTALDVRIARRWLAANAPQAEQPALLTEDGYFTNWPTDDEASAPQAEQE